MPRRLPKNLPHLKSAVDFKATNGVSNCCFHRAAAFVLDVPGSVLCMGTLRAADEQERLEIANASPVPFIHAWCEFDGLVYAPTTIERMGNRLVPFHRDAYYTMNGISDVRTLTRKELLTLSGKVGLSAHLKHFRPLHDGAKISVLLDAAGIKWEISENGGIIPATVKEY